MSYRNCVYCSRTKNIHLWTWSEKGERVYQELPFKPYLYLEDKKGDAKSIFGTALSKREFETGWDRNKFIKNCGIKRLFENLPPYQQFLVDNYYHNCGTEEFSQFPLRVMFLDIECPIHEDHDPEAGFPNTEDPEHVINLLTVYDNFDGSYNVFGLAPYYTANDTINIVYHHCGSEEELLKKFLKYFSKNYPDVLSSYNGAAFDIPYLVNRVSRVLSPDWAKKLSPIGVIYEKINQEGKFGMPQKEYVIEGVSCLDYMVMYKKFAMEPLETYKLDYLAEVELEENKVVYDGSLAELCRKDWNTFVDYNIRDVEILVKLDDKLKYIDLIRFIAYLGLCNMESAIKTVAVINGAVAIRARNRDEKIPTFIRPKIEGKIPGGYVAKPKLGFSQSVVSFDANSLYPSVMISLNMSPETKIGRVEKDNDTYRLFHVSGRTFEFTKENFVKFLTSEKAALSKAGFLFSQKKRGLMPEFLEFLYDKRKEMKAKMMELRKLPTDNLTEVQKMDRKRLIQRYNTFQHAYKITLNSTYGYCANKHAPLGDDDIGSSVTLTGQAVIKKSNDIFESFVKDLYPELSDVCSDCVIYNDTDSLYVSKKIFEKSGICLLEDNGNISSKFFELCDKFEEYLNHHMNRWSEKELLSKDSRFVFKRESICDNIVFTGGKNYVLHVLDDEGTKVDKFKYKGVAVVKTTMPKAVKPYVKKIIQTMVMTQSQQQTNKLFLEAYEVFKSLGPNKIYVNGGINNYEKYKKTCNGFTTGKGMPGHVKAAYFHDLMVDELKLGSKYEKFRSGDKVKRLYLKTPNRYGIDIIGFKEQFPPEFSDIFEVDFEKMFDKIMYSAIEAFYKKVNWVLRKPNENVRIELEDFFSDDDTGSI